KQRPKVVLMTSARGRNIFQFKERLCILGKFHALGVVMRSRIILIVDEETAGDGSLSAHNNRS
ncbi:MAG: hypothetical protein ACRC0H_11625, partial [Aeromonas sobria]